MKYNLDSSFHLSRASSEQARHRCLPNRQVPPNPSNSLLIILKLLEGFLDHLLSTIHQEDPLTQIPKAKCWRLEDNDHGLIDLKSWKPRQAGQAVYRVVAIPDPEGPKTLNPIYPHWEAVGGGLCTPHIKSIQLPSQELFDIQHCSHILVVLHTRTRVKISNKKHRIDESTNTILVPADLKVVDLAKALKGSRYISGMYEMSNFLATPLERGACTQTAAELGWKHGTEFTLEFL
jgi:hypothetical protein